MDDHVIDTNVLLVASAAHPFSPFSDTHVPPEHRERVLDWLVAFRSSLDRLLVLDRTMRIYEEYRHKLTDQDLGLQIIHQRLLDAEFVDIDLDEDGHGRVPAPLARLDRADRKFAAAALAATRPTTVVNCADPDWMEVAEGCAAVGLRVEELLEAWLRERKEKR
jgi:hypothetical protein